MARVIDLPRIRRALSELDRIAAEHPEMCQHQGQWDETAVKEMLMSKPAKERVAEYRDRIRAKGHARLAAYITPDAKTSLDQLRRAHPDLTLNDLLSFWITGQIKQTQQDSQP